MITPRIIKAIDIFLDAINNGTLAKGTCVACAVGNLVAKSKNITIEKIEMNGILLRFDTCRPVSNWMYLFMTENGEQKPRLGTIKDEQLGLECIKDVEFSKEELAKIEFAFETNSAISFGRYYKHTKEQIRADQIKGLEAVVKVMLEFDDCKEEVKEVFTSKAELIPV